MEEKVYNGIEALFDENNVENIVLYNEKEEPVEFEQIAVIPLKEKVYAFLKPVMQIEGVKDDEAFAFEILLIDGEESLRLVEDEKIIDKVFEAYDKLLESEQN